MEYKNGLLFSPELSKTIKDKFLWVDEDPFVGERLFFDNAGGSFRLKSAASRFTEVDAMPDCPERIHNAALYLQDVQKQAEDNIRMILNAPKEGSILTGLTASQVMFQMVGAISDQVEGTNVVTTALEHPSAFDAMAYYANRTGRELRVATTNKTTGGVDVDTIVNLIDENTAILSVMYASNITGAIFDIEEIVKRARAKKPGLYIVCDAVQHAPHGLIDLQKTPVDAINFAPYKFFGTRGFGIGYVSERVAKMPHHKLLGKPEGVWELGSPAPAQYASVNAIVDYVCWLGKQFTQSEDKRTLFAEGMTRIKLQERGLLYTMLEGNAETAGLRHLSGVKVFLDYEDLTKRDFILAMGFDNIGYTQAVREYEKRKVIVYDRLSSSIYSKRMLESFGLDGALRISPLHCHDVEDIYKFLQVTKEIASL